MLEGLVTWVLNNYVGEYLENLNADQISIALLQGQVELENVPLKKTALKKLDIPLEVKSGIIGKLTLTVPIAHIRSEPWVLQMNDLLILLGPQSDPASNLNLVEEGEQSKKEQMFEELEKLHKQQLLNALSLERSDEEQNAWWGASLVSAVSNNIQLILNNVHIRYEDNVTMPNNPFHFGFRIHNISIQTTNWQWKPGFIQPEEGVNIFKKLDIKGLSVFWNCNQEVHGKIDSYEELKNILAPETTRNNTYILKPFSMQVRMEKNASKFPLKQTPAIPRFKFDLRPEMIEIELSKKQLAQMRVLTSEWARFDRARMHRKWRPNAKIKGNAIAWWKFALNRVSEENRRQRATASKDLLLKRARLLNNYCKAYRRKLKAFIIDQEAKQAKLKDPNAKVATLSAASQEDLAYMKQIEHDSEFNYNELHLFRETIFRRYLKEVQSNTSQDSPDENFEVVSPDSEPTRSKSHGALSRETSVEPSAQQQMSASFHEKQSKTPDKDDKPAEQGAGFYGWLAGWFGGGEDPKQKQKEEDINQAAFLDMWPQMESKDLPPNLRKVEKRIEEEVLDVLSESWDDSTILRRDNLLAELVLQLERMIIRFVDDDELATHGLNRVLALDLSQVASRVFLSPREHRTEISLSVMDMSVQRLRVAPMKSPTVLSKQNSYADLAEEESLWDGVGLSGMDTEVLFAVGRTKDVVDTTSEVSVSSNRSRTKAAPLLQLFYRRSAPRLNVFHEIKASFLPVTVVYDEDALDGLANLFDTGSAFTPDAPKARSPDQPAEDTQEFSVETQLFLTVNIPEVLLELRSKRKSPTADIEIDATSNPFATAKITSVSMGIAQTEKYLTRMKLGFDQLTLEDRFENINWPLLRTLLPTKTLYESKHFSRSCPSLSGSQDSLSPLSSSLPSDVQGLAVYMNDTQTARSNHSNILSAHKKSGQINLDNDFGHWDQSCVLLNLLFVDEKHPRFSDEYEKQHCTVKASLAEVELGMNRRTWTMLLNFFGILGAKGPVIPQMDIHTADPNNDLILEALLYGRKLTEAELAHRNSLSDSKPPVTPYILRLQLDFAELDCNMNFPTNKTQLGRFAVQAADLDLRMNLNNPEEPMEINLGIGEVSMTDRTPFYSKLYNERLVLKRKGFDNKDKLRIKVEKHRTDDFQLKRKYDIKVDVNSTENMDIIYVHTHRYFCALLDFWFNFADLQDQVRRSNEKIEQAIDSQKTRCLLTVDLHSSCSLVLPLNQFSGELILLETDNIKIRNQFILGSQTKELEEHAIENLHGEDDYDCLLDKMTVQCEKVRVFPGKHRSALDKKPTHKSWRKIGEQALQDFYIEVSPENVLNKAFQLNINVFRNLSSFISHNLPELSVLTHFENVELNFTTEFYCLLRGFLEKNLGDQLIINPDTIPYEVLQNPDRGLINATAQKYACFSNRMDFKNVVFHFLTDKELSGKFGKCIMHKARISFDAYVDNQSELDIICESSELIDTRYDDLPANQRPNIFTTIVSPRKNTRVSSGNQMKLMSEAHIMMRKDEPPVITLVLMNSRVLLILDWLNQAKDFVLKNTDFLPPEDPSLAAIQVPFAAPKEGILLRNTQAKPFVQSPHTITLKITLKESDLVLLEKSSQTNSLTMVAHATAVLCLDDRSGVFEGNFEVQNIGLSWCLMSAEHSTHCQITNEFDLNAQLVKDSPNAKLKNQSGLDSLEVLGPRQNLKFEIGELVARLSYKDILVVKAVLTGALERLAPPKNAQNMNVNEPHTPKSPKAPNPDEPIPPISIKSITLNAPSISIWLLDDSQGVALPLIRLISSDLRLYQSMERLEMKLKFSTDYFNQRIFGWEPLIEPWDVESLQLQWSTSQNYVKVQPSVRSPLNFNVTQTFVQQAKHFSSKWNSIKTALETDLRTMCVRSRSDHLPYLLRNETGADLIFTTAVDEISKARKEQRKPNAKWFTALTGKECTFEFPTKLLTVKERSSDRRSLVIRVDGWHEVSPVSVDSVGIYFRVAKLISSNNQPPTYARLVIAVTMEPDGRKVVTCRSALMFVNNLASPVQLSFQRKQSNEVFERRLEKNEKFFAPLKFVDAQLHVRPIGGKIKIEKPQELKWQWARNPGDVVNKHVCLGKVDDDKQYWICISVKREHYPEDESLCGHSIYLIPTLNVLNLLPTDIEFRCNTEKQSIQAGQRIQTASINVEEPIALTIATDKFVMSKPIIIHRSQLSERQDGSESSRQLLRLFDSNERELQVYASVSLIRNVAIHISLWVPFWIVNRSGIPLVIKQDAAEFEAAGQMSDHEKAKDRNPMMFSFSDPDCPNQCVVRIGDRYQNGYKPKFSRRFALVPGVQALKLTLTHDEQATQIYNIGVEVRQGTGRYKDTQVVLFAPRYRLNNQSSTEIYVAHPDEIRHQNKQVSLASKSNLIWHETFEDKRKLCCRLSSVTHWSCPFRIDQVGSFHVTMRDRDETPRFVRVEVTLNSASFWVTFTDAAYFPAPIQIENQSNVPVLYQQQTESAREHHLRTICKANSVVEYAWDDLYASKLLTLQVYENKSHTYEPSKPSQGPPLIYENHVYLQFYPSFKRDYQKTPQNDERDLVFTVRKEGKVHLSVQNLSDSSHSQLWSFTQDNCLENVGFNYRKGDSSDSVKYVLDVMDGGSALMMRKRDEERNSTQRWRMTNDGRLRCGLMDRYVDVKGTSLLLSPIEQKHPEHIPLSQQFRKQRQKPGSGVLDVQCLHVGPTLVVRITDRADKNCSMPSSSNRRRHSSGSRMRHKSPKRHRKTSEVENDITTARPKWSLETRLEIPAGLGISVVNNQHEELLYALFKGVELTVINTDNTYQMTGSVAVIQVNNQLLYAEKWPVLYCEVNAMKSDPDQMDYEQSPRLIKPALKLEMSCNPREHYDAFDCFRIKLCDMCLMLDEQLLWKIAQFIQETGTAETVSPQSLLQPPNIEPANLTELEAITRRCYFGTLELEIGNLSLTVLTVAKNGLPRDLRKLKEQFNVKLVSFENALVSLPPFRQFHYFETLNFLVESLSKFYLAEFQKQTMKVIVTMDAFGNPQGLASDLKESFQGLLFEGDVSGFVSGLGYGVTNSISKVASSMAHGVGSLTFDEQHEVMRRRMLRSQSQAEQSTALSHLYGGVKGLGVGVFGGLTALAKNTIVATQEDGLSGIFRGVTTGAVDTVTKPVQGVFDFLEGTASAMKEVVGGPLVRKSHFPNYRIRMPRVCTSLQSLLPCYDDELAEAQQELLRINGYSTNEILLGVVVFLSHIWNREKEVQRALICSEQCYILKQINDQPNSVIQRIVYRYLKNVQPTVQDKSGLVKVEILYEGGKKGRNNPPFVWCSDRSTASRLADQIYQAKQRYDHSKRTLTVVEDLEQVI